MNPEQAVTEILKLDSIDKDSIGNFCTNNDVSLLSIAEASLYFQQQEIVDLCEKMLTPAQSAVLSMVVERKNSGTVSIETINKAIDICQDKETRDLGLEGRVRMERGLVFYTLGEIEKANDDLTWAETRLKSVAKASKDHDLSLLNKAAFHQAIGEDLMALQVYGDISVKAGHAHETIAISRLHASRINARIGHQFDAIRLAFNSHRHAIMAGMNDLALEAGTVFVDLSLPYSTEDAERMIHQIENAKPRDIGDDVLVPQINPIDIDGVFTWCYENLPDGYEGESRGDLQAVFTLAHKMGKTDLFADMLSKPEDIEDGLLIALIKSTTEDEDGVWAKRIAEITAQSFEFLKDV